MSVVGRVVQRPTVLLVAGSIRRDGLHRRLAAALRPLLVEAGVSAELVDLGNHPMPIYHGDEEALHGPPDEAVALTEMIAAADGLIVLSPEHNGGPSALLKNTIDWITRVDRQALRRPLIGIAAASPGGRGAIGGLGVLRTILEHMRASVHDAQLSIANGRDAFTVGDGGVEFARPDDQLAATAFVDGYVDALRSTAEAHAAISPISPPRSSAATDPTDPPADPTDRATDRRGRR